jgi:hypothetical protein
MRLIDQIVGNYRKESLALFQKLRELSQGVTRMTADAHEELLTHFIINEKEATKIQITPHLSELNDLEREVRRKVFLLTAVDLFVKQKIEPLLQIDPDEAEEIGDSTAFIPEEVWTFSLGIMLTKAAATAEIPTDSNRKEKRTSKFNSQRLAKLRVASQVTVRHPDEERIVDRKWPFEKLVRPHFQVDMEREELWIIARKIFIEAGLLNKDLPLDDPIVRNCYRSLVRKQQRWEGIRINGNGKSAGQPRP